MALGKLLDLSVPCFSHLQNRDNNTTLLTRLFGGIHELVHRYDFLFLGSKITADGDCSHEIKRCLLLARKVINNLDSILKSRDIILPIKVRLVKAMIFQQSCMDVRVGL